MDQNQQRHADGLEETVALYEGAPADAVVERKKQLFVVPVEELENAAN